MEFKAFKMDGLGNDFVIIDQRVKAINLSKENIVKICSRDFIGCDQLIYINKNEDNKDKLVNILGRHVFSKRITSSDINDEIKIKAINGEEVTIKKVNGIVYINEGEVVTADIVVSNGVIHFINRVLQPLN